MKMTLRLWTLLAVLTWPMAAQAEEAATKWRVTVTMSMPGMKMQLPPQTFEYCRTKTAFVPQAPSEAKTCKMVEQHFDGKTATWKVHCDRDGHITDGEGKITYDSETFQGEIRMKGESGKGRAFEMVQQMSGQKLGPCKP